jgi:predicted transcriptional regulator
VEAATASQPAHGAVVSFRVPADLLHKADEVAAAEDRSRASVLRRALRRDLAKDDNQQDDGTATRA